MCFPSFSSKSLKKKKSKETGYYLQTSTISVLKIVYDKINKHVKVNEDYV